MEERQEPKHVCKFCNKSFPNGRSLGGHMRSHISNVSAETEKKLSTSKLNSSLNNGGSNTKEAETSTGYDLRENPKKTSKFADLSDDTLLLSDKFCKECGKGFPSWKALFGHMKCHSKERASIVSSEYDQDSWTNINSTQKLVMDSQSDNEATALNRRRRSKRTTRYISAAANSSVSFANPSSSSVSEVEQEQEEVAMSLMMLSRDVGNWGGLNFVAECSDNNSAHLSSVRTNLVSRIQNGSQIAKLKKLSDVRLEVVNSDSANNGKKSELFPTECSKNVPKMNKSKVSLNGHSKDDKGKKTELDYQSAMEDSDGTELNLSKSASIKFTSIKRKFTDSESKPKPLKNLSNKPEEAELSKDLHKRGKFECTTCNKIFHSYQALGGHRASHKKIKAEASSENSIETDPTTESMLMKKNNTENENGAGFDQEAENVIESKKSKNHECPICFKVFPSGQALGGHKRSHFAESKNCQTVVRQEPEIRDLLDLNLPAAAEEESNSQTESYKTWWVGSSHKQQEALVGLISN